MERLKDDLSRINTEIVNAMQEIAYMNGERGPYEKLTNLTSELINNSKNIIDLLIADKITKTSTPQQPLLSSHIDKIQSNLQILNILMGFLLAMVLVACLVFINSFLRRNIGWNRRNRSSESMHPIFEQDL